MMIRLNLFSILVLFAIYSEGVSAQTGTISGKVIGGGEVLPFAGVVVKELSLGAKTNTVGNYSIQSIPYGTYVLEAFYIGFPSQDTVVVIDSTNLNINVNFDIGTASLLFDEVVVSGTKTEKRQTDSPIIVNVLSSQALDNVQACNLAEGLKFQPGLRVETDCQTCNYTQLRMNGLAGGYSQILINGRPIFSPLTGLYGMEQLPVNMIDRIEVVRGGGSSLYGSSAIGGTVNVITKLPKKNAYAVNYNYQQINGQTADHQVFGNGSLVNKKKNAGVSLFMNYRNRDFYDHNGDNFSELPLIRNAAVGTNIFLLPKDNQKLELSLSYLNEYRFGGEMALNEPAFMVEQAEERTHHVLMGSADYQVNFNDNKSSLIFYTAIQNTIRDHYTGIIPDGGQALQNHLDNPPYGTSDVLTYNAGLQFNHKLKHFLKGENVLTFGSEFLYDDVNDVIPAYHYLIDQTTTDIGMFLQSDWEIIPQLTLLTGLRADFHNMVDQPVFSPRASLFYKLKKNTQFRINYGAGFRAPQAFDADLHIAFAGGGVSRISLSPNLKPERSHSYSASINYDRPSEHVITGFTVEGFYTRLNQAFFLQPIGQDPFGERFEKQNGQGATVQGTTIELRANYDKKVQVESGITIQTSQFDNPVQYIEGIDGIRNFIRTPNQYGFAMLSFTPNKKLSANINYVYTGTMQVPHFAGAPNQLEDEIFTSPSFSELSGKIGYTVPVKKMKSNLQLYGGVKNALNAYQTQFDIGKNRDSNFIYGPAQPRTFYIGIKLSSF
ncbi:MAG: TonB-dependent receptor [Crocinitomicaceae bacterium]